jgi:hypothetical protein
MSKRPTPTEIRDAYRPNVEALSRTDLLRMVRGGDCFAKGTPQYIKKELQHLANIEARSRGIEFPTFTACFTA